MVASLLFTLWVAVLLTVTLPLMWLALAFTPAAATPARVRRFARFLFRVSGCPLTVSGAEHLDTHPSAVIVANHVSYLDSVVLLAALPRDCRFVTNHMAATRPLVGLVIRKCGHVIVDRRSRASRVACVRTMLDLLEQGHSLALFPEGRRADTELLPFHSGAFRTAARTGRPVIPVAINSSGRVWPKGPSFFHRHPISVRILPALVPADQTPEAVERLRDDARAAIARAR